MTDQVSLKRQPAPQSQDPESSRMVSSTFSQKQTISTILNEQLAAANHVTAEELREIFGANHPALMDFNLMVTNAASSFNLLRPSLMELEAKMDPVEALDTAFFTEEPDQLIISAMDPHRPGHIAGAALIVPDIMKTRKRTPRRPALVQNNLQEDPAWTVSIDVIATLLYSPDTATSSDWSTGEIGAAAAISCALGRALSNFGRRLNDHMIGSSLPRIVVDVISGPVIAAQGYGDSIDIEFLDMLEDAMEFTIGEKLDSSSMRALDEFSYRRAS